MKSMLFLHFNSWELCFVRFVQLLKFTIPFWIPMENHLQRGARPLSHLFTRYSLGVQYFGPGYRGWTPNNSSSQKFIPSVIYQAVEAFIGKGNYENLLVSSRTDAGVHAFRNVFQIDLCRVSRHNGLPMSVPYSADTIKNALNHNLFKEKIFITDITQQDKFYDARGCATGRSYFYKIMTIPEFGTGSHSKVWRNNSIFNNDRCWIYPKPLNIELMKRAAVHFTGERDFKSVQGAQCESKSTWRHVRRLDVDVVKPIEIVKGDEEKFRSLFLMGEPEASGDIVTITVAANAFLRTMVRNIVAILVEVGSGRLNPDDIPAILNKGQKFGLKPAPPQGLYLANVEYEPDSTLTSNGRYFFKYFLYFEWLMRTGNAIPHQLLHQGNDLAIM